MSQYAVIVASESDEHVALRFRVVSVYATAGVKVVLSTVIASAEAMVIKNARNKIPPIISFFMFKTPHSYS